MIYKINADNSLYYFLSKDVKVFPCSYRGNYTVTDGDNTTKYTFDPESRLNTEYNYITLSGTNGHNSYIKSYDDQTDLVCCVVGGYYFELKITDLLDNDNYKNSIKNGTLYIFTNKLELTAGTTDSKRVTPILKSCDADAIELDKCYPGAIDLDGDSSAAGVYLFTGITLSTVSLSDAAASLQLFDEDGNINKKMFLPMLYHGAGENSLTNNISNTTSGSSSIALGENLTTNKNYQTVVGKYNENVEGEFVIGSGYLNGTSTVRKNSLVANGDNITINKNLKIKNGETDTTGYVNITPDTTSIKTKKFTITDKDADKDDNTKDALVIDNQSDNKKVEIKNINSTQSITLDSNKAELKHSDTSKLNLTSTEATLTAGTTSVVSSIINLGTNDTNTEATINGTLTATGATTISDTTEYKSATNFSDVEAALKVAGGVHIADKLNVSKATTLGSTLAVTGATNITNTTPYSSSTTGEGENAVITHSAALKVAGGVHIADKLNVADNVTISGTLNTGNTTISGTLNTSGEITFGKDTDYTYTDSTHKAALKITGGVHIGKKLNVADKVTMPGLTAESDKVTISNSIYLGNGKRIYNNSNGAVAILFGDKAIQLEGEQATRIHSGLQVGTTEADKATNLYGTLDVTGKTTIGGDLEVGNSTTKTTIKSSSIDTTSLTASTIKGCTVIATGNDVSGTASKLYYDTTDSASDWIIKNANHTVTLADKNGLTKLNKLKITGNSTDTSEEMFALYTGNQGAALKFKVDYDGNVTAKGEVEGVAFNATSDRRLKENLKLFKPEKSILDLSIYRFDYIKGTKNNIGCIAQELQEICPELVSENENGYLSVKESKLVYLLLEEVKLLKEKILKLEKSN